MPGDLWAKSIYQSGKLYAQLAQLAPDSDRLELDLKAFEVLLQLKQVLPVIDQKMAGFTLPGTCCRYLSEEFDHIDFQAQDKMTFTEELSESNFVLHQEFDESNTFFGQSIYVSLKLKQCPLATLSVSEISKESRQED